MIDFWQLITKDAFEPSLPLSVVVHIDYRKAPLVIQRSGDIKRLVEQTLDPMVSVYFKNIGQTRTLIQLIQDHSAIQQVSGEQMKAKGKAEYERSRQEASRIQTLATAEAEKIRILGEGEAKRIQAIAGADAERTARVGIAQAMAIEERVRAYGGPRLQLTQQVLNRFAEAIQVSQVDVVPKILIAGQAGKDGGSPMTGNVMEALLTLMMSERLGGDGGAISTPRNAPADAIRRRIEDGMKR